MENRLFRVLEHFTRGKPPELGMNMARNGRAGTGRKRCVTSRRADYGGRILIVAMLSLGLAGCGNLGHPAQRLSRYAGFEARSLAERVAVGDEVVIDRAHRTNLDYKIAIRPKAVAPNHPMVALVRKVVAELPPPVRRLAEKSLVAVYLVRDDFGTAVTEGVIGPNGRPEHGYIGLNVSALNRKANAWATWKENSAFRPAPGRALGLRIEDGPADDQAGAVRFILLHELGHLLGLTRKVHPYWEDKEPPGPEKFPYLRHSWRRDAKKRTRSRWRERYPRLHQAEFYRFENAPFSLTEMESIYTQLSATDLPSLYGVTNPYDDFAEAFVIYIHTRLLKKPYRVSLLRDGREVGAYQSCLQTGKCPRKAAFLEKLLESR